MADVVGDAVTVAEGTIGISASTWITLACLVGFSGALLFIHHEIYEKGYAACSATYKAAADQQNAWAHVEIAKIGDKYARIDQNLQKSSGFMQPVSPLVAAAIGSMHAPSKHRSQ